MDPATSNTDPPGETDRPGDADRLGDADRPGETDRPGDADRLGDTDRPRGQWRRGLSIGALTVLAISLLGAPLGLLWAGLAPDVPVVKTTDGAVLAQPQPEEFIAADGWFSLLALAFGVLVALAVWWVLPRWRGPVGLLVAVTGALGAALVAWGLGRQVGLGGYRERLAEAAVGEPLSKPADLRAGGFEWLYDVIPTVQGDVLLGAFGAAVTYTLLAGWSNHPDLVPGRGTEYDPFPVPPGEQVSSGSPETPDPQPSPVPPEPGEAGPARG